MFVGCYRDLSIDWPTASPHPTGKRPALGNELPEVFVGIVHRSMLLLREMADI